VHAAVSGGLAAAISLMGLVAFATPALAAAAVAQGDGISSTASCISPLGSGMQIKWTIANNVAASETGSVTSVTGGLGTLSSSTYAMAASSAGTTQVATLLQTLPAAATGSVTLDVSSTWANGLSQAGSGTFDSSTLNCAAPVRAPAPPPAPVQTIAGHIYLCANGHPTTTEETGGTLAADGAGLTAVAPAANPLGPTDVSAGAYTMTATSPRGFQLVACGGASTPNGGSTSASEPVNVPKAGAGVGIFYVAPPQTIAPAPVTVQTIAGHIYLCTDGQPTTTEETGGTLAASGPGLTSVTPTANPLAPSGVTAGTYTMTATSPQGFQLVACGGTSTPDSGGASATQSVSVPKSGTGVGLFYVSASSSTAPQGSAGNNPSSPSPTPTPTPTSTSTSSESSSSSTPPTGASDGPTTTNPLTVTGTPGLTGISCPETLGTLWNSGCQQNPGIALKKTANVSSFSGPGTRVTYSYKVTNTGNVTLDPVTVTDPMAGLSAIACPHSSLSPSGSETCTATYTTTQADVDRGVLTNTATAHGTPPHGPDVTATSSLCIPACQHPAIALKKSASVSSFSAPGTLVTYSYKVTNTGNVTLDPVTVTDPMAGLSAISCPDASLSPSGSETCTATYTTTQADVDRGVLRNTGTAHGTPPKGPDVTATSSVCIPACQHPAIALKKTASIGSFSAPGTLVTYSYKVTNTGNVTLDPVTVTDPMVGLSAISCPDASLAPAGSETCTATYTTTQADVDRGVLRNTGTAHGTPPKGPDVTATSSVCIPAEQSPAITLKKTASVASFSAPGTLITYSYKVTNTGNVTLDPVTVADPMAGLSALSCPDTSLAPTASETCTATYTTTQTDVDNGSICNTGTATGTPPQGQDVTDQSSLCVPAEQSPSISVVKTADVPTVSVVGQVVTYTFLITNTGNVTLHDVDLTDAQVAPSLDSSLGPITCTTGTNGSITLAPQATDTCSATYTVTQADLTNGSIKDTATVTGQPPSGPPVTDVSSLSLTVTSVSVVKAAGPSGGVVAGSTTPIVYTLTVTNTGTATTTAPIVVTDSAPTGTTLLSSSPMCVTGGPPACSVAVSSTGTITWTIAAGVAPGASYALTYSVTANTNAPNPVTNTATWSGPGCGLPAATTTCTTNTVKTPVTNPPAPTPPIETMTTTITPPAPPAPAPAPVIAFTGAFLSREWMIGAAALLLGAGLVAAARWRRRSPRDSGH